MKKLEEILGKVLRAGASICLGVVFVLFILNIATRIPFFTYNPTWIDETIQFFLVWMIFLGAAELVRIRGHFVVDILTDKMHGTLTGRIMALISTALMLTVYAVVLFFGIRLCLQSSAVMYTLPFMKKSFYYACVPVSAFFMVLFTLRDFVLSLEDLFTGGKITERLDLQKQRDLQDDEDARAISEAAKKLKEQQ